MARRTEGRLLEERPVAGIGRPAPGIRKPSRSVTVNLAESPLGWLRAHGQVDDRQFEAGERLRRDFELAQLGSRVTMDWSGAPVARSRGGGQEPYDPTNAQIDARYRFDAAIKTAGPGLSDILWRVVCSGDGMRAAETALGWPSRAGKLVLTLALDRLAIYYRIP